MSNPFLDSAPPPQVLLRTGNSDEPGTSLTCDLECDVLVVGGGYTGLSSALHLAEKGKHVVLLEAKEFGWGASGRSFGQIVPYAKHDEAHILKTYGSKRGQAVVDLLAGGPRLVFELIDRFAMDCEDLRTGMIVAAHGREAAEALKARREFLARGGADVAFLEKAAAADAIGSEYYPACLLDRRAGSLNPRSYVRGLAAALQGAGARTFCKSPVRALGRKGTDWHARTPEGSVTAKTVVVAVNAYVDSPFTSLWPELGRSLIAVRTYQLVSAPLSENVGKSVLPRHQSMTDTRHLFSGIRRLADGRLQVGADGPAFERTGRADTKLATERIQATFPQIDSLEWAEAWPGWVAVTKDQYPRLHQLEPEVWCAFGYSGRGIAFGTLMGREIARNILRDPASPPRYPVTPVKPIFGHAFAPIYMKALMAHYRRRDSQAMTGYVGNKSGSGA